MLQPYQVQPQGLIHDPLAKHPPPHARDSSASMGVSYSNESIEVLHFPSNSPQASLCDRFIVTKKKFRAEIVSFFMDHMTL